MSRKKPAKKAITASAEKPAISAEENGTPSPYLPVAHPPAKHPMLLVVSVILFVVWFIFLVLAAISSLSG